MRAVFLDVDDTVVDYEHAARTALAETVGSEDGWELWTSLDDLSRFSAETLDYAQFRVARMRQFLVRTGRGDDAGRAAELDQARFDALIAHCRLFDDVLPCLAELRSLGLRIGLITNNETAHQRRKIAAVGLDALVDSVSISQEVGVGKPDPRIFAHACTQLGVDPGDAMHVGDSGPADVDGAAAFGLHAVWLDRPEAARRLVPTAARHDTVASLAEVAALVTDLLR